MADFENETDDLLSPDVIARLKSAHGEFIVVKTKLGSAAFRAPNDAEYGRYNAMLFEEKTRPNAFKQLACFCVVHPDRKTFEGEWLIKAPAIAQTCVNHILDLAGYDAEAQTKKY